MCVSCWNMVLKVHGRRPRRATPPHKVCKRFIRYQLKNMHPDAVMVTQKRRDWKFRLKVSTTQGETVGIVGNCPELGDWKSKNAVFLSQEICSRDEEYRDVWSGSVSIPAAVDVEFRYFVCVIVEPDGEKYLERQIIVRRWETHFNPRIISKRETSNMDNGTNIVPDVFGYYNYVTKVEKGWLTAETVVQLKLFNNPICWWKRRLHGRKVYVKVTPVYLQGDVSADSLMPIQDSLDESMDFHENKPEAYWPITEVAVMTEDECSFKSQEQFGQPYNEGDFMIFQIQVLSVDSVAYMVDFYIYSPKDPSDDIPRHVGFCYVLPSVLRQSIGQAIVPITSVRHQPIGQLTVEYVVAKPIEDFECDMSMSYAKHWKHTWRGLDVGHRGAGNSFKHMKGCANVRENTIASLTYAASHGADFVEFDVQLSKDHIPVIYHDFHVCISMKKKRTDEDEDMLELPVKDLTLDQLHMLKVYHLEERKAKNQSFIDDDLEDHQPFPTLQHALETLDTDVGLNIEIKWTMKLKDGTYELENPFDLNMYLDIVVKTVLQYGSNRKIVFSCFHPDICSMIRLKQNKYPVMFLTQGVTVKYPDYHDPRTNSIPMAVYFALSAGLLGINVHTEDILRDPSQVAMVQSKGLVLFCWGEDNNDKATIAHLKQLGLHAVIYDRIDEYSSEEKKESIFMVEAREARKELLKVAQDNEESKSSETSVVFMDVNQGFASREHLPVLSAD